MWAWRRLVGGTLGRCTRGRGWRVRAGCQLHDPGFERVGPQQAASDAREDQPEVASAEREGDEGEVGGGGTLLQGGGKFLAVLDELAHQTDEAAESAGSVLAGHRGVRYGGRDWEGGIQYMCWSWQRV